MIIYPPLIATKLQEDIDDTQTTITLLDIGDFLNPAGLLVNDLGEPILNDLNEPMFAVVDWFYITLYDQYFGTYEVVRVVGLDELNNAITVERGVGNLPASAFLADTCAVIRWPTGLDWEDLRTQFYDTFALKTDLPAAVALFLDEPAIQALMDTALIPYISTLNFEALVSDFRNEVQANAQINTTIQAGGYTTPIQVEAIFNEQFNSEVIARDLKSSGQVEEDVVVAVEDGDFLTFIEATDNDEPYGILDGNGTTSEPLLMNWEGTDLSPAGSDLLDVPLNNAHRADVTTNPHAIDAQQVQTLTTALAGDPSYDAQVDFEPLHDLHPATKLYADSKISEIADFLQDLDGEFEGLSGLELQNVPDESGIMYFGKSDADSGKVFCHVWQKTTVKKKKGTGEGNYRIDLVNPLDHIPVGLSAIIDVTAMSAKNRKRADLNVYIATNDFLDHVHIILDDAWKSNGLGGTDFTVYIEYYGILTL